MKKVISSVLTVLVLTIGLASVASAKDQLPNADVYLGTYDLGSIGSEYSDYCTATQSHINLVISPAKEYGGSKYIAQYRKPNGSWTDMSTTWTSAYSTSTYNINATKGYDYRLQMKATGIRGARVVVTCY
ncbi:hypothetical protein EYB33_23155 [Lysinibacillus sphaericus]|uniref:hypothetical protein n=1 Tax=Lysinibacillus sphaericus TaxID=1421 RepID=UPI001E33BCAA|nr:hypothetical protein [Lysinibacillus sphaericus]UDK98978.1 hypothetical protein EYB33_23155 [Lysinibacillus sphaericus]